MTVGSLPLRAVVGGLSRFVFPNWFQPCFLEAHESGNPYERILMDIMMPEVDGLASLLTMRKKEADLKIPWAQRVKIIMTTALDDPRTMMKALFESDASTYLVKPIRLQKLEDELRVLKLIA